MRIDLLPMARGYVGFLAFSGFVVGQVFFGIFELKATLAGLCGLLAAAAPPRFMARHAAAAVAVLVCCVVAIACVAARTVRYYTTPQVPGNSYPWLLMGLFCIGLAVIAWTALTAMRRG